MRQVCEADHSPPTSAEVKKDHVLTNVTLRSSHLGLQLFSTLIHELSRGM
jgi:hypothetical protein